ncbi:hypothetical protein E5Q_02283 [Mixia osmundae IAM 14324]|uniref:Endonuclease n=1 Tax=Mixia osmundae (strain CBS 9802 / IAM 14324 / JCM 22182 / KY 12970) TaxID=764103 RepID=G7DYG7_MIXOS|nr:hypothetical protein E5Q_02283 [Mixia osmundae IAM 14324]
MSRIVIFGLGCALGAGAAAIANSRSAGSSKGKERAPEPARNASTSTELSVRTSSELFKFGYPGPIGDLLRRQAYVAAYDRVRRHPAWTAEHLTADNIRSPEGNRPDRKDSFFHEDIDIPERFRARLSDYQRSGYDRGHMVPAADARASQDALNETFKLSNIAPQVGEGFNRDYWAWLESYCRNLTSSFQDVYIFTIPLYIPKRELDGKYRVTYEVIGPPDQMPNVSVPTHFAKVILAAKAPGAFAGGETSLAAFVLPNAPIPETQRLESFIVPVDAVERAAGMTLFNDDIKARSKHLCATLAS